MDDVNTPQYPQFYIATKSAPADDRVSVLKYGRAFAIFDRFGDIASGGLGEQGIFFEGTRFLSELALFVGNTSPLLLSSTTTEDNCVFTADLTNVDVFWHDKVLLPRGTLHVRRSKVLWDGACYERIKISNYGLDPVRAPIALKFQADFVDVFEVRGSHRARRGEFFPPDVGPNSVTLRYQGLDGVVRRTRLVCEPQPARTTSEDIQFQIDLPPQETTVLHVAALCESERAAGNIVTYDKALSSARASVASAGGNGHCTIQSANIQLNNWIHRSAADINLMTAGNPESGYPYAGIPWFSTVFGRDGIIVALQCLWMNPGFAKGVLLHLAETQARETSPERDAEPGKILHEARQGEMAALGEVPFGRYYGSVDSTPLFVMLAGAYYARTGDGELIQSLWPHIEAALGWIDKYGDRDGDGFVEYSRNSPRGLVQQGWKDSNDSVFHADGHIAEPPIALCEVQGYVYAAKKAAAVLAKLLRKDEQAKVLSDAASKLKTKFAEQFWCDELGTYALALDGRKNPCRVRTSNPGHCLFTLIAAQDHAEKIAERVLLPESFSGWGIRTVNVGEARYNPISYHNGSIWPHDNALCAAGLAYYGFKEQALQILVSLLDASSFMDLNRMPELFCGLERRSGEGPVLYPVACSPQAWAAGAVFLLLEACLGVSVNPQMRTITLHQPKLPPEIPDIKITELGVGDACVSLAIGRSAADRVEVRTLSSRGDARVIVE